MPRNLHVKLSTLTAAVVFAGMAVITAVIGVLAYRRVYDRIQDGFDRKLLAVSTVTAAFIDGDEHQAMMRLNTETSPLYRKYIGPMQRIQREKDLTYLYTQIPTGGANIIYGLDGTIGADHSPISSPDTAPAGEVAGILGVYEHGNIYLSGMRVWQEWGLLKSAFVPIYNREGAITAMSGADVNISIIKQKTRVALLAVTGCGLVLLAFAGFVSTRVARRVTEPLGRLKHAALQVAAGRYGLQADIRSPTELRELAGSFNQLSRSLEHRLRDLRQVNASIEQGRRERLLHQALQRRDLTASPPPADCLRVLPLPSPHECRDASGWVRWQNQMLFWAADLAPTPLAAARTRHDLALVLQPLLHQHGADPAVLALRLEPLFRDRVHGFLAVNLEAGHALFLPRRGAPPHVSGAPVALEPGQALTLPSDRLLAWASRPEAAAALPAATAGATGLDPVEAQLTAALGGQHALVVLWRTGRQGSPLEALRAVLREKGLIDRQFAGLAPHELDLLLSVAQREKRLPEQRLTLQGERNDQLHLMLDGRVRIDAAGGPIVLFGGHWIGEFSFLYGGVANATVTALSTLDCLVWERAPLLALLQEHPSLERNFLGVLAKAMTAKLSEPPFA
jgi:HAMP domain-containing protein